MKIWLFIIASAVTLSGCATVTSMYADCESKYRLFAEVTQCTKLALKSDSRYSFHKGYQSNANRATAALDFLEEKVTTGAMSEKEARFRVQEILAAMRAQDMAEFEAITTNNPAFQRSPTVRTNCTTFGGTTNCTSR